VLKLKEKIAEEKGTDYAIENQKLIYAGKLLKLVIGLLTYAAYIIVAFMHRNCAFGALMVGHEEEHTICNKPSV